MHLGLFAFAQQLQLRTHRRHDRPVGERIAVFVDPTVVRRPTRFAHCAVSVVPAVLELRRIGLSPVLARQRARRLHHLRVHFVEISVERVHQRDVEAVLPDALRAVRVDAVVVPGAIGREHEVARPERHALAIHGRISATALHDEAQRRSLVAMRGGELARVHHLHAGVEQARGGAPLLAAGVDQHHYAPRCLFRRYQHRRPAYEALNLLPLPERGHGLRLRVPGLDLVRHGPERAERLAFEAPVVRLELGRVLDVGAADDVFALHGLATGGGSVMRTG